LISKHRYQNLLHIGDPVMPGNQRPDLDCPAGADAAPVEPAPDVLPDDVAVPMGFDPAVPVVPLGGVVPETMGVILSAGARTTRGISP
jgi:hypothetical protein